MRVCVLYGESKGKLCGNLAKELAQGLASQGHSVDIIDMKTSENKVLAIYEYLVIGTASETFWGGKIAPIVETYLKQSSALGGKRCFAFVAKRGLRTMKSLQTLMKVMEAQGMFVTYSDVLKNGAQAREVGKRLNIA